MSGSFPTAGRLAGLRPERVPPVRLHELAELVSADPPPGDPLVHGITLDSRAVRPGDLYAALPGARAHGADYALAAAAAGAVAVLTDRAGVRRGAPSGLPVLVVEDPRAELGGVAARVYGDPTRGLLLLGVTGTNGKTTATYLLDGLLRRARYTTGLVGTIETRVAGTAVTSVRTTPEAPDLQALFAVMRERGVTACAMEVSSHALALRRVDGCRFDVAGFLNLSPEHLDFHGDLEAYYRAKASLFTPGRSRVGVVDVDGEYGVRLAGEATIPVTTVSPSGRDAADWRVHDPRSAAGGGTRFDLVGPAGEPVPVGVDMPGDFNVANAAVAAVMLVVAGVAPADFAGGWEGVQAPGRMERVAGPGPGAASAVVDYAHTPDAIERVLTGLHPAEGGRVVAVLGAGGDRDPGKRAPMGAVAARLADVVVVTDDNPRSEDPAAIRAELLKGTSSVPAGERASVYEVAGRAAAIRRAVACAEHPADLVVVLGKGHETEQEMAGVRHPFDDRTAIRAALAQARVGA